MDYDVKFCNFKIQNIVCSCDLGFCISLQRLFMKNRKFCHYDPEVFPGLKYKVFEPTIVLLVFSSGKVVFIGAKSTDDINQVYENVYPVFNACITYDAKDINKAKSSENTKLERKIELKFARKLKSNAYNEANIEESSSEDDSENESNDII